LIWQEPNVSLVLEVLNVKVVLESANCELCIGKYQMRTSVWQVQNGDHRFFPNVNFVLEEVPNVNFVLSGAKSELHICQVLNVSTRTAEIE
jgi:hypothetical protein